MLFEIANRKPLVILALNENKIADSCGVRANLS